MQQLTWIWLQFAGCAAILTAAGVQLSRYGDIIADKTGISGSWVGLVLLAGVTSLPELVTGLSAVTLAQAPNIALGDVLGSCVFNLLILVVVDSLQRGESVYRRASQGHILSAGFGVILIGFTGLNVLLAQRKLEFAIGHVGAYAPVILVLYLVAVRAIFDYEREQLKAHAARKADRYPAVSLRHAATRYLIAALAVVLAGTWLPVVSVDLARAMGWHTTFFGTLFVAGATSLPELAVTVGAVRIGAVDMAIANLLGSNMFNIAILVIDDLAFLRGPLLSHVSPMHAMSALSAVVMTGIVVVALLYRPRDRLFRTVGWASLGLFTVYLLNTYLLYLHGD
jgi:cation:H+ antiporter